MTPLSRFPGEIERYDGSVLLEERVARKGMFGGRLSSS